MISAEQVAEFEEILENVFIYAVTWSVGCTTTSEGRKMFNEHLRNIIE